MKKTVFILLIFIIAFYGCKKDDIEFEPTKNITYYVDSLVAPPCIGDNEALYLDATTPDAVSYLWNTGQTSSIIEASPFASYTVLITTSDTSYHIHLNMSFCGTTFYIPNVFTPDGDGMNDYFGPQGYNFNLSKYQMKIYNSDLKTVYSTRDVSRPWIGKYHNSGEDCPSGYYYYFFEYTTYAGLDKTKSGMLELLR